MVGRYLEASRRAFGARPLSTTCGRQKRDRFGDDVGSDQRIQSHAASVSLPPLSGHLVWHPHLAAGHLCRMTTDNDYAHNVTYESINNPAFSTYPDGRPRRRLSAPASSRGKVQQEQGIDCTSCS